VLQTGHGSNPGGKSATYSSPADAEILTTPSEAQSAPSQLGNVLSSIIDDIQAEQREDRRERLVAHAAALIERRGLAAVLEVLGEREASEVLREIQVELLDRLARKHPRIAADFALRLDSARSREAMEVVMALWAADSLADAVAWAGHLPSGEAADHARLALAVEAARADPATAVNLAREAAASPERDALLDHAASEWASTEPAEALTWLEQLDDPALRAHLVGSIATVLADRDPIAAAEMALSAMPDGRLRDDVVVGIVQRWSQASPDAAAAWVARFPESALRTAAVENVVKLWPPDHQRPASDWLSGLAPGASRDAGFLAYAEQIAPHSPQNAASWAGAITNPVMRDAQLEKILEAWKATDPTAARRWLQSAPLPPATRTRLLAKYRG
jgi:hypothetical protein